MAENTPDIEELLKQYPKTDNRKEDLKLAKLIISEHYKDATKADALEVIDFYLKEHFGLKGDGVNIVKAFWKSFNDAKKSVDKVDEKEENKEEKERKAKEAILVSEQADAENVKIREKRQNRIIELYDVLRNKDGTSTVEATEDAKVQLKELMLATFWKVEGFNLKTLNKGHLSLQKLAIADYMNKAFNLVRFGGRIWWYDWQKAYYTYDQDDEHLNSEVARIMNIVGDGNDYVYNGNSISDKAQIIDMASLNNPERVYTDNPFNKHAGYINAKNGVLRLDYKNRKVELVGKKPDYMFSYCIDTEYNPDAVDTEIHEMLRENLGEEQRDCIYQMVAIAIRDTDPKLIPSKIAYLFMGPRNTGKNVVMQTMSDFFGNQIVSRIPLIQIAENKFVKPLLEGKLINLDDELPANLPLGESREIKSLTGGKFHTLEPKGVKPYSGVITALLVFAGNQFPKCHISKEDSAFWDRWEIINFNRTQHTVDEEYVSKLLTPHNLSGFFNRVIQKLFEIHDNKIKRAQQNFDTYAQWMCNTNSVFRFVDAMTRKSPETAELPKETFFKYYTEWCEIQKIPTANRCEILSEFGRELKQMCDVEEGVRGTYNSTTHYDGRYSVYLMNRYYDASLLKHPDKPKVVHYEACDGIPEEYCVEDEDGNYRKVLDWSNLV